jgi:hypothetical protein
MPGRLRANRSGGKAGIPDDADEHAVTKRVAGTHVGGTAEVQFAVAAAGVGPSGRLISSNLVTAGDGTVVLDAYADDGRRSMVRADAGEVHAIPGFRSGATGVRAGARLNPAELLVVGDGAAYRVDLAAKRADRLPIRRLPRNISHVHALDDNTLLVSPLFADTVAVVSLADGVVTRQFRSPAHEVVRREKDDAWLVNASRGRSARHHLDDFEVASEYEFPVGATPVDDGAEVFSLPGTPYQTGGISRASFVQIHPSGTVQACRIDGTARRDGPGAPGLDQLLGIDGHGRLVGLAGSSVVLLDRKSLAQVARLPLLVRRLLSATMTGATALALLQPLPPLVHFVSW